MRRRLAWSIPALFAALVLAAPLAAQAPAPAPAKPAAPAAAPAARPAATPTAGQTAAALDLFKSLKLESQIGNMAGAMINSEIGNNPGMQPYRDVMLKWLQKYMTWDAMKPELIQLYTEAYTEAELKELAAFYKTSAGQKSLEKAPELMQKTAMIGAHLGQPHTEELKKLLDARRDELTKEQEKSAAAAGKAPAGKAPAPAKQPTAKKPS